MLLLFIDGFSDNLSLGQMEILGKFATSKREPTSPRAVLSPAGAKVYRLFCCRVGAPRGKGLRAVLRFVSLIVLSHLFWHSIEDPGIYYFATGRLHV